MLRYFATLLVSILLVTHAAWAGGAGFAQPGSGSATAGSTGAGTTVINHVTDVDLGRKNVGSVVRGLSVNQWHGYFRNEYVYGKLHASNDLLQGIKERNGGVVSSGIDQYLTATSANDLPSNTELFTANLGSPSAWIYYNGEVGWYTRGVRYEDPTKLDGYNSAAVAHSMYNGRGTVYSNTTSYAGTQEYVLSSTSTTTSTDTVKVGDFEFATVTTNDVTNAHGVAAVDVYEATAQMGISPIVLDLGGSGKLDASGGDWLPHRGIAGNRLAMFDINANGLPMLMEWVGPNSGLLVEPRKDGVVDGTCLFGTTGGFDDGFEKLALRDGDGNGCLRGAELRGLSVWIDRNANARAEAGEVRTLESLGITELAVKHDRYVSSFVIGGKKRTMWDWWPTAVDVRKVRLAKR